MNFNVLASSLPHVRFPILGCFLVFVVWLAYELRKQSRKEQKAVNEYWDRENKANQVRKKPLDDLSYIQVPFSVIPEGLLPENETVQEYLTTLHHLSEQKIVNLSSFSNTELKMTYGTANLPLLSEYDQNFTLYARTLYLLAKEYYENGFVSNAQLLLEKAVEGGSDISGTYRLLLEIYKERNLTEKIEQLKLSAQALDCVMAPSIQKLFDESTS